MAIIDTFEHNSKTLEIRLFDDGERYVLRATDTAGNSINGYEYSVKKIVQTSLNAAATLNPLRELAKAARRDVESDAWQKYIDAVRAENS